MKLKPLALSLVCLMLPATAAWGRTFVADNIKYEVMSESEHTARLIGLEERNLIISIPGEVTDSDSGDTFSVAEVGPGAFKGMNFYDIYVRAGKGPLHFAEGAMESATVQNLDLYRDFTAPVNHEPFYEMESLKTVTISDGCTYIPPFSFAKSSVSSVSVNSTTLETIGFGSFEQTPLTTLSFSSQSAPKYIGGEAFFGCSLLKSAALPEGLISIGEAAFSSCSALASVSLPSTVKSIAATSFTYCIKLSYVSVSSSNPNYKYSNGLIVADAQLGGVSDIVADTPDGTVTLYRLDGVKVYEGPRDGMGTLPSGIYVVNGRKVIL